jgi:DNA helicase-2/ATP-dependent DNA helicase PcrA
MPDASDILAGLNPAQREAVETVEGPVLVLAGPGSGKTRVLTHRVAHLVREYSVPPWQILAVTFTNKAAREMKQRLQDLLGKDARRLTVGTFHAICARILRREADAAGLSPRYVIYDASEQLSLVRRAIKALDLDDKLYRPTSMHARISAAKNELITPDAYPAPTYREEVVRRLYEHYEHLLAQNDALDFDDLLLRTVHLFRTDPQVRAAYQRRYPFLLVDEWQDTNMAQYELIQLLAGERHNVFVVGDEDQSIYAWRGADFRNVQRFRDDFPEARVILLERNYRSTKTILDAANAIIAQNRLRHPKTLVTDKGAGPQIMVREAYNEQEEADFVVSEIQRLVARRDVEPGDVAVMYRTNAQSRVLEDAFVRRRMPYRLVGATRFYERREIKDVLAYLRVIHNPYDGVGLLRIINVPPRAIGKKTLADLDRWAAQLGVPIYAALQLLAQPKGQTEAGDSISHPFATRAQNALLAFVELLDELVRARQQKDLLELVDLLLDRSGYQDYIRDGTPEGEDRWANILELRTVARDYAELPGEEALTTFLEEVALVSDVDDLEEKTSAPVLLTLHSAKGLEFPVVFILGLEEGILPHSRSMDDPDGLEEERRLCYVGVTRAKEWLYLLHTFRRTLYGESQLSTPSRFLLDVPPLLTESRSPAVVSPEPRARPQPPRGAFPSRRERPASVRLSGRQAHPPAVEREGPHPGAPSAQRFRAGDRVRHETFGSGIVVESRPTRDGDEQVTVAFEGVGIKRLMASLAPMHTADQA